MTTSAAIYCRISSDPRGEHLGVDRQRDDCDALAKARGWPVHRVYTDNDTSAYSGKPRPGYDELVRAIRAGHVNAVIAWHPDRLHRSPVELESFIELITSHGVSVETVQAGRWDLSSASGRLTARTLGNVARHESEHKSERVKRALEQNATNGKRHGRVPFGWRHEYDPDSGQRRDVVEPQEAQVVEQIAKRLVSGDSLAGITRDLNESETPSPRGGPWHKGMVRHVVLRERNVSLRVHRGEIVGAGDWPPILDRALWEQARAVLRDPTRRTSVGSRATHLLSGLATCGVCGSPIRAGMNRTVLSYRCASKSCVSRNKADVDDLVTRVVCGRLAMLDSATFAPPVQRDEVRRALAEAAELRARLDVAADDYADGKIDARQLERISARIRPKIATAEASARVVDDAALLDGVTGTPDPDKVRERWDSLPLTRQRAIVDLLMTVAIDRTTPGARTFDPESVKIAWKTG